MTEEMCAYCAYETRDGSENYNSVRMISCYVGMKRALMVTWTCFDGDGEFDITEIDITESDVTETDITESDITESDITESDIT